MAARQDVSFMQSQNPKIRRHHLLAQRLMEQGQQPTSTEMVSGVAVQQSPLAGLAKALQMGAGGFFEGKAAQAELDKEQAARSTMADAMEAYNRSQSGGQTQTQGGETINWNKPSLDSSANMYSKILMGNEDTAGMGMQSQMQNMQAQQNAAREMQMFKDMMPLQLDLARQKAAIEAQYRPAPASPASWQEYQLSLQDPGFAAFKNKQQVDENGNPVRKLTATEQKEVFDIQEKTDATTGAIAALKDAQSILKRGTQEGYNEKVDGAMPYTGFGADARTQAARLPVVGGLIADKNRAAATTEAKNLVTEQALGSMKAIFGGNPTEGERQILLDLQALPTMTPQEQDVVITNAIAAAERRAGNFTQRLNQIGTGDYFNTNPNAGTGNPAATTPYDQIQPLLNAEQMGGGQETKSIGGKTYVKIEGQWFEQ